MAEAAYQFLTLYREGDKPEIGELRNGEVAINVVDARLWCGDEFAVPVELGGNIQESIISTGGRTNYISVEVNSTNVMPIEIPDPNLVSPGTYREIFLHLYYPIPGEGENQELPVPITTHAIAWDRIDHPPGTDNPFVSLRSKDRHIVYKIFAFGPRSYWFGKVHGIFGN